MRHLIIQQCHLILIIKCKLIFNNINFINNFILDYFKTRILLLSESYYDKIWFIFSLNTKCVRNHIIIFNVINLNVIF